MISYTSYRLQKEKLFFCWQWIVYRSILTLSTCLILTLPQQSLKCSLNIFSNYMLRFNPLSVTKTLLLQVHFGLSYSSYKGLISTSALSTTLKHSDKLKQQLIARQKCTSVICRAKGKKNGPSRFLGQNTVTIRVYIYQLKSLQSRQSMEDPYQISSLMSQKLPKFKLQRTH